MKLFPKYKSVFFIFQLLYSIKLFAVCDNVTVSGTVAGDQSHCGQYNPNVITNVTYPTGGTGTLEYQWQVSNNGTTWTNIAGATLESYDPSTITNTLYYHRLERRSNCTVYVGTSNMITKTVIALPTVTISAGGPVNFCLPGSVTLTANASPGVTYQWRNGNVTIIGATQQSYVATTSGDYKVLVNSIATGCNSNFSNIITVGAHTPIITTITDVGFNPCGASTCVLDVQSSPGYTYQWYEDTVAIPLTNSYELNYGHNSTYSCMITNACGSYSSGNYITSNFFLDLAPLGLITAQGSTALCPTQSVVLSDGNQSFGGVQWYKDGVAIPGADQNMYTATQAGLYMLRFSWACLYTFSTVYYTSNPIYITSLSGTVPSPSISASGSTALCPGQSVLLTEVTGPGWTYQWAKNNVNIAGATNSTYSVNTAGTYYCIVSNMCGGFNSNSIVFTQQPVTATISILGSNTICAGSVAPLTSSSAGIGGTYQWKQNGSNINGATQSTYSATTAGNYTCAISNACTTAISNTITIIISGTCGIGLVFDGSNDYVKIPSSASYAFGTGNFTIEAWIKLSQTQNYFTVDIMSNRALGSNAGFQFCIRGGQLSMIMGSTVASGGPTISTNICHHVAVSRTALMQLSFYIDGTLAYTYNPGMPDVTTGNPWLIGADANNIGYLKSNVMDVRLWSVSKTQAQIQASMNMELFGNESNLVGYWKLNDGTGQVVNDYSTLNNDGQLGSTVNADINDPIFQATCAILPPTVCPIPTGLSTTNITNTSAKLNWAPATADTVMVRYAVHNTTNFVWKKVPGPVASNTTITGLLPATQYDWWVRSLCNGGSSSNYQSVPATFTTTSSPVPCVVPYGLGASNIGNTSATISWTNMVTADTFRVRYSVNGTTNFIWKDVNGASGSSTSLSGLSPNTTYQFQVSSKCNGVTTAYSSSFVFTTLNTPVPCITPYGLGANTIQNTSAIITWTNLVTADTFRIRYSVNTTTNFIWKDVNGGGGSSTTLSNLLPNTSYQFQVSSKCNGVTSAYSNSFVFTTLNTPVPCIVPYGLSTTNITNNSAKVNWTPYVSADTFRVRYSINGTTNYLWKDVNGGGGTTNTTLTGLNSSATYQWQVRTICNGVQSAYSSSVVFSTAALREAAISGSTGFENLILYPNPAHSKTTFEFNSDEHGNGLVKFSDLTGRILYSESFTIREGLNVLEIDVAALPRGIYVVQLQNENSSIAMVKLAVE